MPAMSPPAQNPFPAPVRTSARMFVSAATCSRVSTNCARMSSFMALRLSGLFNVTVATPSTTEIRTRFSLTFLLRLDASIGNGFFPARHFALEIGIEYLRRAARDDETFRFRALAEV